MLENGPTASGTRSLTGRDAGFSADRSRLLFDNLYQTMYGFLHLNHHGPLFFPRLLCWLTHTLLFLYVPAHSFHKKHWSRKAQELIKRSSANNKKKKLFFCIIPSLQILANSVLRSLRAILHVLTLSFSQLKTYFLKHRHAKLQTKTRLL